MSAINAQDLLRLDLCTDFYEDDSTLKAFYEQKAPHDYKPTLKAFNDQE